MRMEAGLFFRGHSFSTETMLEVGRPYILSLLVVNFYPFLFPLSLLFLFLSRGRAGLETSRGRVTIGASKGPAHPARPHCCCDWIQYHPPGVPRGLAGSLGMFCPWMAYADEAGDEVAFGMYLPTHGGRTLELADCRVGRPRRVPGSQSHTPKYQLTQG